MRISCVSPCRQYNYAIRAGAQGFAGGLAGAFGLGWYLQRTFRHVRQLPMSLKAGCVFLTATGVGVIYADKASIKFDQMHYKDSSAYIDRRSSSEAQAAWSKLSTFDKSLTWAKDHKFSVVLGSWLGSMGLSWLYIQTQPLSFAQKLVQARVWAQGLTVASMIGMAALLQIPSEGDKLLEKTHSADDTSWEKRLKVAQLHAQKPPTVHLTSTKQRESNDESES